MFSKSHAPRRGAMADTAVTDSALKLSEQEISDA